MIKKIKNRKLSVAIIAMVLIVITIAILYQQKPEVFSTGGSMTVKELVAYQKSCGDMQKQLGKDSLYPVYYTAVEREKEASNSNARKNNDEIESGLIQYQALDWYAQNHGMAVTEADVQKRIEALIDHFQVSVEYQEYQDAARELGTTYEDILRNDYQTYYFAEVLNRVYMKEYNKFMQTGEMTSDERDQQDAEFQKHWDSFVNIIIKEYQKTQDFENMCLLLSKCQTLATKDVSQISQIKKAGL